MRKEKKKKTEPAPVLKTEGPLSEKDAQGEATERGKLLAKEALEKWTRLKKGITNFIRKK
jgi:hypothetical protein